MKRFAAGAVAVATALSLSTGAASAKEPGEAILDGFVEEFTSAPHWGSFKTSSKMTSDEDANGSGEAWGNFYKSSYENDLNAGYKAGTTADILWGFGIAAAVLAAGAAAVNAGVIPGVSLPF